MPDKNVQLPDGRVVAFPDSMADADISAVIKKQLGPQTNMPAPNKIPPNLQGHPEQGFQPEDIPIQAKAAATALGGAIGGEAVPVMRGVVGVLARMLGSGTGAALGNTAGQVATTGTVDPMEVAKTGASFAAGQGVGEAFGAGLGGLRSSLSRLMYTGEVAKDGTPMLTKAAKALVHPTELPENILRATVPPPPEALAAAKTQAGEANAAELEARMTAAETARQKELVQWERLKNQEAQALMTRGKQQAALDKAVPQGSPTPFPGSTPSNAPNLPQIQTSPFQNLQVQPKVQIVSKFETPEGKIVSASSTPPDIKVTYQSIPQKELLGKVMGGDRNAIFEWMRRGLDLPDNVKFMVETASGKPWRNASK